VLPFFAAAPPPGGSSGGGGGSDGGGGSGCGGGGGDGSRGAARATAEETVVAWATATPRHHPVGGVGSRRRLLPRPVTAAAFPFVVQTLTVEGGAGGVETCRARATAPTATWFVAGGSGGDGGGGGGALAVAAVAAIAHSGAATHLLPPTPGVVAQLLPQASSGAAAFFASIATASKGGRPRGGWHPFPSPPPPVRACGA